MNTEACEDTQKTVAKKISRIDAIIESLSQMDKYSKDTELRAGEVRQKLEGNIPYPLEESEKHPTRDGKLGDIEGLISDIFYNLDGIRADISRLEELV